MDKKFYITTAIAYASKKPHIGNDHEIIYSDAIARFKRLCGYDVFFLTGTDNHGQKIEELADENKTTPLEYSNNISEIIMNTYKRLGISNDKFIKTTDGYHEDAVKNIFTALYKNGDIYKSEYEGMYCVADESFYTSSQIKEEGICPDCGGKLKATKEEAYSLKLSKYQEILSEYIENTEDFLIPDMRKKEMVNNFIKPGLQDLCVSRSTIKWGVPIEFDTGHVIYVWIDALSNYITALGYNPAKAQQDELFQKYWPCDLHVIGKDIFRFHSIYWPVILWGLGLPQPKQILGHPWLLFGEDKMSKSKGNVVATDDLLDHFGVDAVRYCLLAGMPFDRDGSFTFENFLRHFNSDLVNTLSNLVNRTLVMAEKYFASVIPVPEQISTDEFDAALKNVIISKAGEYARLMNEYKVNEAIGEILELLYRANKYIDETTPWILAGDESKRNRLATVIYNLLECIRIAAIALIPIIPDSAESILRQLATKEKSFDSAFVFGSLETGLKLVKENPLFMRIDEAKVLKEISEEQSRKQAEGKKSLIKKPETVEEISIEDFMKTELRIAQVIKCEKAEKSDKLLKLTVDLGYEQRQVVSGIAKFYKPEDLTGRKIILVSNLKKAVIRGIESHGMILASGEEDVKIVFAADNAEIGSRVR